MTHSLAMRLLLAFLAAAPLTAAPAQPDTAPPPAAAAAPPTLSAPKPATVRVALQTAVGPIVLELEKERAPVTTANFLRYVDAKRLDGAPIYRVVKVAPGYGLVQGGVRDPAKLYPPIAHEPTTRTGLSHKDGAVSMARNAPGTAQADFFIVVGDLTSMDADPSKPGDNQGFAVFGHVAEGMDLVRKTLDQPTSATVGPAEMKGQMLVAPLKIVSARRAP